MNKNFLAGVAVKQSKCFVRYASVGRQKAISFNEVHHENRDQSCIKQYFPFAYRISYFAI